MTLAELIQIAEENDLRPEDTLICHAGHFGEYLEIDFENIDTVEHAPNGKSCIVLSIENKGQEPC